MVDLTYHIDWVRRTSDHGRWSPYPDRYDTSISIFNFVYTVKLKVAGVARPSTRGRARCSSALNRVTVDNQYFISIYQTPYVCCNCMCKRRLTSEARKASLGLLSSPRPYLTATRGSRGPRHL